MSDTAVVYRYDGSFDGFLCCVFESYVKKEIPVNIVSIEYSQFSLYKEKYIETVLTNAQRVYNSFEKKMGYEIREKIRYAFLTCIDDKEYILYKYIRLGYEYGKAINNMITNDIVDKIDKAVKHMNNEAHLLKGFIRFEESKGVLIAYITPKNFVLPLIAEHFMQRYPEENFLIYDKTHKAAIIYKPYEISIQYIEEFTQLNNIESEENYQELWKEFYNSIAIKERYNPKCRMNHMPKRYWANMTEVKGLL